MDYNVKSYESLELPQIRQLLSKECQCEESVAMAFELTPAGTAEGAKRRLRRTSDAVSLITRYGSLDFGGLRNIEHLLLRAEQGGSLSCGELLTVADVLKVSRRVLSYKKGIKSGADSLSEFFSGVIPNTELEERITFSIISPDEVADNASSELLSIRRKSRAVAEELRVSLQKIIMSPDKQKYLQEALITVRDNRYVIPVKSQYRSEFPGLVHDTSGSGGTYFIEPMVVVEANNKLAVLRSEEQKEIARILLELSGLVGAAAGSVRSTYKNIIMLDFAFACGKLSFTMDAREPEINTSGIIDFIKARHPLIPRSKAVPINVKLGEGYSSLIITGPNTGGKTVALKTVGLLSLMAACGLHIPVAENSKAAFFKNVMADIGDEQSIEQSLSTFSAHMKNIIAILGICNRDSLVLFDEIGAGTDPVEGAALAIAVLERVKAKGATLAATTHYAELKMYALNTEGVENASCEFDIKSLKPTYRLLIGVPGRSNAFAIAERLGLSDDIIERASELISADNSRFEEVITKLETARQAADKELEHANDLLRQASARKAKAEQEYLGLERTRDALLKDAEKEKERLLSETRKQVSELLAELSTLTKELDDENARKKALEAKLRANTELNRLENEVADKKPVNDHYKLPRPLKIGDSVFVTDVNRNGTVQALADKNGKVVVIVGSVKMKLDQASLRLLEGSLSKPKKPVGGTSVVRNEAPARLELDIRGKTALEAEIELDSFIDNAIMNKVKNFTVIHGKGTGALRAAVIIYLRAHKAVKSYRQGLYGEGEHGVTVVELK